MWLDTGFGLVIGFTGLLQTVTTIYYSSFTILHTLQFAKPCTKSSLCAAWQRLSTLYIPRLPCSTAPVLAGWRLSHANSSWPQPLATVCLLAVFLHHWLPADSQSRLLTIYCSSNPVQSSKLLLALASTLILGCGTRRDPWPYFYFQTSMCF
jgi:hypothetical protein